MNKKILREGCILSIFILILASFPTVVGTQDGDTQSAVNSVQLRFQRIIDDKPEPNGPILDAIWELLSNIYWNIVGIIYAIGLWIFLKIF